MHTGAVETARVAVLRSGGEYTLVSAENLAGGAALFVLDGVLTGVPTRYSVQLGRAIHLDLPDSYGIEEIMDRFYWRFMNHSCAPNAMIRGREVFALRPIEPLQEITFNYNTTEYDLADPFDCRCGSPRCAGRIRGFRWLGPAERQRLRPWLADHLRLPLAGEPAYCVPVDRLADGVPTAGGIAAGGIADGEITGAEIAGGSGADGTVAGDRNAGEGTEAGAACR
jgi:hypothetical protein